MATKKYLDEHGLETLWAKIKLRADGKIVVSNSSTGKTDTDHVSNPYLNFVQNDSVKSYQQFSGAGYTIVSGDTCKITIRTDIPEALPSTDGEGGAPGLMSAEDKEKIDQLAGGGSYAPNRLANGATSGVVYTTSTINKDNVLSAYTATPIKNGVPYYQDIHATYAGHYTPDNPTATPITATAHGAFDSGTTYNIPTGISLGLDGKGHVINMTGNTYVLGRVSGSTEANHGGMGLMTVADKDKLDNIAAGATVGTTLEGHYDLIDLDDPANAEILAQYPITSTTTTTGNVVTSVTIGRDVKGHVVGLSANTMTLGKASNTTFGLVSTDSTITASTNGLTAAPIISGKVYYKSGVNNADEHYTPVTGSGQYTVDTSAATTSEYAGLSADTGVTVVDRVGVVYDSKGHQINGSKILTKISIPNANRLHGGLLSYEWAQKLYSVSYSAQPNTIESIVVGNTTFGPTGLTNKQADLTSAINDLIDAEVASAVTPKGTKTFAQLTGITMSESTLGDMYNISDSFTIDSSFKEYDPNNPKTYPAGSNVVCVEDDSTNPVSYKWDVMGGFVDLSSYATSSWVSTNFVGTGTTEFVRESEMSAITDSFINALS